MNEQDNIQRAIGMLAEDVAKVKQAVSERATANVPALIDKMRAEVDDAKQAAACIQASALGAVEAVRAEVRSTVAAALGEIAELREKLHGVSKQNGILKTKLRDATKESV